MSQTRLPPLLVLIAAAGLSLSAGNPPPVELTQMPALGAGNHLCRDWLVRRSADTSSDQVEVTWLHGFFSGRNAFSPSPKAFLMPYDERALVDAVVRFCEANPDDTVATAAYRFAKQLGKRPQR